MTLDELYSALLKANKNGKLNLVPGVLSSGSISDFYQGLTNKKPFIIEGATIDKSDNGKTITINNGTTSIIGIVNLPVKMTFTKPFDYLMSELKGLLIGGTWDIDNIDWFSIGDPFVTINADNSQTPINGNIGGKVAIGTPLTLTMDLPIVMNQWVLKASYDAKYPSISYFYQLIGGVNIANVLPAPINTFTDLGVRNLSIIYDANERNISSIGMILQTSQPWHVFSNLTLNELDINLSITNPRDSLTRQTDIGIIGYFNIGDKDPKTNKYPNTIKVGGGYPPFVMSASLEEGTIQLGSLIETFIPNVKVDLNSEIDAFNMQINPTGKEYLLSCNIKSDWTFFTVQQPHLSFTMTRLGFEINNQQGTTTGTISGIFHIGSTQSDDAGVDITLFATYADATWSFGGSTGEGQKISLVDIAFTFLQPFGIGSIPSWVSNGGVTLAISDVSFLAKIPDVSTEKSNSYKVGGTVDWALNFSSFNLKLNAVVDVTFTKGKAAGKITSTTKLLGLTFDIGYQFGDDKQDVYLEWEGIKAKYTKKASQDIFEVTFNKMSLGDIITKFMDGIISGFQLSAPWNVLNSISLDGLSFIYTRNIKDRSKDTIVISYSKSINLGFISFSKLTLTKDKEGVHLGFEGSFLGLPITTDNETTKDLAGKGSKVQDMPSVPGMGSQLFDLKFLGLGQHLELTSHSSFNSVDDAITAMSSAFKDTNSNQNKVPIATTGPITFNQNSDWLIGADFTVAQFYRLAFVFNDPNLYGLVIGVSEKAPFLKNLQFEILYKKINDSTGVYQIKLQLPDQLRYLQFGAISVTLPNIGVKIYTNGNFYLDIGWPTSITDFSRSFTVQVFPFIGSGGFYFASLKGSTATGLPEVQKGIFNPVIEAGIALSLGLGKTINKGILKAGLSLTATGVFQGVYASFTPNPNLPNGLSNETDTYYKFTGTLALVGRIYGQVNFAIISASFDITAYVQVTMVIEAYKAIPINFEAGVSVNLSVRINLGLFKITIHLGFSTTISSSFVIGSDHEQDALWYKVDHTETRLPRTIFRELSGSTILKWQPIIVDTNEKFGLDLYFAPHLTVSGETITNGNQKYTPGPQYIGMLYIDTNSKKTEKFTQLGINALATGILYWALNAIVGSNESVTKLSWLKEQQVSASDLNKLLCYIETRPNNEAPFNYKNTSGNDIESFLKAFFTVQISAINEKIDTELSVAVFPMFPELQMQTKINDTKGSLIDFSTQSMTGTSNYISDVTKLLKQLSVDYESAATANHYKPGNCEHMSDPDYENQSNLSMPTFIFTDFIALATKQLLQNAKSFIENQDSTSIKVTDVISGSITPTSIKQLGGMASRFMLHGLRLPEPPNANSGTVQPLYVLTGQQWTVPDSLVTKDTYQVNLINKNASWITFLKPVNKQLEVVIGSDEIQRTISMRSNTLNPSVIAGYPKAIKNINHTPQNFSLGGNTTWHYPGDFFNGTNNKPTLWKLPSNFGVALKEYSGKLLDFKLKTLTSNGSSNTAGSVQNLKWCTSINITLQKITAQNLLETPLAGNVYNLVGADDASIKILEDLLIYKNKSQRGNDGFIEQIQFLMKSDPNTSSESGFISSKNGDLQVAIVQANLSTETNPSRLNTIKLNTVATTPTYNTINKPEDFIKLLWECSIVRSGGFYFYYITPEDSKGLPKYLFNESGTANLQIVITYANFIAEPFINSVITGDDLDLSKTAVYAQSDDITVTIPILQPGNVGYELSRNNPGEFNPTKNPPTTAEDQIYLQKQFNLLGGSLPDITQYKNYLPAGPTESMSQEEIEQKNAGLEVASDPNDPWNYTSVIPYYKFVQGSNDDSDYLNPYAGIGTNVAMQLNWQDMFGNIPTSSVQTIPVKMDLLYTDTIISVSKWPSVSSYYLFQNQGDEIKLAISFCFDVSKYNDGTSGALHNATVDLATYMNLYYQLGTGDIKMSFTSTIEGTKDSPKGFKKTIDITTIQKDFLTPIINYLKVVTKGNTGADTSSIPVPYSIFGSVDVTKIADYSDSIPLEVTIEMVRTKNVDPNFTNVPGVASALTAIKPQAQENTCSLENGEGLSLSYFANKFETAFRNKPSHGISIKIATASEEENNDENKTNASIWMVRFDNTGTNGIKYTYNNSKVYFFSPIPLANSLVSLTTSVKQYQTGKAYPSGEIENNFSSIDLDDWGKQFLEAVDALLAPGLAVPTFLLDNGETLQKILDYKEELAKAIEGTIDYIIDVGDKSEANIGNAQEKWKQEILKELSNTYKYSAAIQTPVKVNSSWKGSNSDSIAGISTIPKLYGNMVGNNPSVPDEGNTFKPSTEYSLSTSKLPMGEGDSWLTYMFESKDTSEFRNFQFENMQYKVSHLEQQIHTVDGIDGYNASTWLTFVLPLEASLSDIGKVIIPIPLRAYPTPPSIIMQSMYPAVENIKSIQDARKWDFLYAYKNAIAAQDSIEIQIELNISENQKTNYESCEESIKLDVALAQFIAAYPQINADLNQYLMNLTQKDVTDQNETYIKAKFAVEAFKIIISQVARAWGSWNQVNPRQPLLRDVSKVLNDTPQPIKLNYTIIETGEKKTGYLNIHVISDASNAINKIPIINISGYTVKKIDNNTYQYYNEKEDKYLTYQDRNEEPLREVVIDSLDILQTQNAWGGAQIIRNLDLLPNSSGGWQPTNKHFLYQTPLVKFYAKLIALLVDKTAIDITTIATDSYPISNSRSLKDNMLALFETLTENVKVNSLKMKLTVDYTYKISDTDLPVNIPVLLAVPFDLGIENKGISFSNSLTNQLQKWLDDNIPGKPNGFFNFEINIFSSFDSNILIFQLPLFLKLN